MTIQKLAANAQLAADLAHFIFIKRRQWFNDTARFDERSVEHECILRWGQNKAIVVRLHQKNIEGLFHLLRGALELDVVLVRTIALADQGTELLTELSSRKNGDVILKFTFSCSAIPPDIEEVVSELLSIVFLHGGQLTLKTKIDERPSFTLLLPGYDA